MVVRQLIKHCRLRLADLSSRGSGRGWCLKSCRLVLSLRAAICNLQSTIFNLQSLRVNWSDQSQLGVENAQELLELPRPRGVARGLEQGAMRSHVRLEVGSFLRQQGAQNGPRRLLMEPVLRRGRAHAEGLLQEGDADPLHATQLLEDRGRPGSGLDHLGEQR